MSNRYRWRSGRKESVYGKLNQKMRRKLAGLFIAVVLAFVALAIRLTVISASSGQQYAREVLAQSQQRYSSTTIPYRRGDILDANGNILATSRKVYNVILDCYAANEEDLNHRAVYYEPTIEALVEELGADEQYVRALLTNEETRESRYRIVRKGLTVEEKQAFEAYLDDTTVSEGERDKRSHVRGIWFEDSYSRVYPMNTLACDVLGFTNAGGTADWGLEGYYNNTLTGLNGRRYGYYTEDADLEQTIIEPVNGQSIVTTIDANIQQIAEKYIDSFMKTLAGGPAGERGASNIGVLIMDPNTGGIYAMASSDPYDPNDPRSLTGFYPATQISAMSDEQKIEALNAIWRNFCISDTFEPGSTFKPITMSSALEDCTLQGNEHFFCDGYEVVAGTTIKCANTEGHGEETLCDIIVNSCNDGIMQLVSGLGVDEFCKYQTLFNFGLRTGIDLSGEASGILHTPSTMGEVDLATSAFGQGFTCTMVQEACAFASVINGGYYWRPHLVSKILDDEGRTVRTISPILMKQTISTQVSDQMRGYLREATEHGTGVYARIDGYSGGGKTGTAQKIPRGNGKYLVSYIGFWPANDPQVVCYVVIDEPNVQNQANSAYAKVVTRQIMSEVLPYMNIFPDVAMTGDVPLDIAGAMALTGETVPDTNVPTPEETEEEIPQGNTAQENGFTNQEAGLGN